VHTEKVIFKMADTTQDLIRVVVAMNFSDEVIEQLQAVSNRLVVERHFPDVLDEAYANAEVLYTTRHFPDPTQTPHLRWIQLHSAGVEHALRQPIVLAEDIAVTSASGIHATPIAEYCISMMLAFMYKIPKMVELKAKAEWSENQYDIFKPHGLRDLTVGIVGYGSIGREVARIADAMGMTILATKRDLAHLRDEVGYNEQGTGDPLGDIPERLYPPEALGSMVQDCDFVVVATPLTEKTHHLVDETILQQMKSSSVLINIARGNVVDEAALISALAAEQIGGAALDVFAEEPLPSTSPLWNLDNVIISPHVSGNNTRYHEKAATLFAENLRRYVNNHPLLNRIDRDHGY
jgi:phosphoglycerate dehydrogenase-like enzyme